MVLQSQAFGSNGQGTNKMSTKNLIITIVIIVFLGSVIFLQVQRINKQEPGLAFLGELQKERQEERVVREPAVAGEFYPADPQQLSEQIDQFLTNAEPSETEGAILALILPHAGYQFSGQVAAHGFKKLVGENIDTVILIGNSHTERFEGISVFAKGFYKTPLGEVEIDSELAQKLIEEHERILFREAAHLKEHSLEVELPFLQVILRPKAGGSPDFKIVPIIFGNSGGEDYKILAQALLKNIQGKNVLLIASSDLSHYPSYEDAKEADGKTIEAILTGEPGELEKTIQGLEEENIPEAVTFACGEDAIKTVMLVTKELGADEIKLLNYANSGDVSDDKSRVVGYGAIGFFGEKNNNLLSREEQQKLLEIARTSVESFVRTKQVPKFTVESLGLQQNLGAFVTLKKQGQLRGCIGRFSPTDIPLYQVVSQMAVAAATQDKRFYPVQESELEELHYEISVLSPLKKIAHWQEIELGKQGVQIQNGLRSGVFLPQVATDMAIRNGLSLDSLDLLDEFMGELCSQKAGLAWDCWKQDDIELYTFTAQIFEEE